MTYEQAMIRDLHNRLLAFVENADRAAVMRALDLEEILGKGITGEALESIKLLLEKAGAYLAKNRISLEI